MRRSLSTLTAAALRRAGAGAGADLPARPAGGGERDAAPRRPSGGAAGGVLLDRRRPGVHLGHRRRGPAQRPPRHHRGAVGRARLQRRLHPRHQRHRCAEVRAAVPRRPDLLAPRDLPGRERHTDRHPGSDPARQCLGRRAGRLRGRNAVRVAGALGLRPAEPEVLRAAGRCHLVEHDQRPGGRTRREGSGRHPSRLAVCAGRPLRPRRRQAPGHDRRYGYRLVLRHCLRTPDLGGVHLRAAAGRPARPEDVARYSFQLPDLPGGLRPLRDPEADDDR